MTGWQCVTGWQYRVCEQGGNIKCVNRWQYRACEQGGNIERVSRVAI